MLVFVTMVYTTGKRKHGKNTKPSLVLICETQVIYEVHCDPVLMGRYDIFHVACIIFWRTLNCMQLRLTQSHTHKTTHTHRDIVTHENKTDSTVTSKYTISLTRV